MDRITVMSHVCDIFNNGIAFVISIGTWIEISPFIILIICIINHFGKTVSRLNILSIIEYIYDNNSNVAKISAPTSIVELLLVVIYFIMQLIDGLSLNITLLIEFGANIDIFAELILHLTVHLSINVNYCYTEVIAINGTWDDFLLVLDKNAININVLFRLISRNGSIIDANKNEIVNMKDDSNI